MKFVDFNHTAASIIANSNYSYRRIKIPKTARLKSSNERRLILFQTVQFQNCLFVNNNGIINIIYYTYCIKISRRQFDTFDFPFLNRCGFRIPLKLRKSDIYNP